MAERVVLLLRYVFFSYIVREFALYQPLFTPDTIIPNLYNPQSLNRFSYVQNNPIKFNDPTGHAEACLGEGNGCGRGANIEEIWKLFRDGRWDGLFAEYYAKLALAERAVKTYEVDKSDVSYDAMVVAVKDARTSKRWASAYVPQDDVTQATQTYPSILGGGYIDTEYSLGDDFGGAPGEIDPGDPFQQEQTPTPTFTPTPTQSPKPTRTPSPTPTSPWTHRLTPIPRRHGGEIIDQ